MAPEQGPDSKTQSGKIDTAANEEDSAQNSESIKNASTSQALNKDSVGWIYLLRKEQLIEQCKTAGITTAGYTVEHLRKQLAEYVQSRRSRASSENLLQELENEIKITERSIVPDEVSVPQEFSHIHVSDIEVMNIVQKWNLKFSGETDLMEFLERLEELAEYYHISLERFIPPMIIMLNGNALKWFRIKKDTLTSWQSFRSEIEKFFLPTRYLNQLEKNFYNMRQNNREHAKDYVLNMLTLARQHPDLRKANHLDRIYDGLRTEYRHYVRRTDFSTLDELIMMTDEYEALKREERQQTSHMISNSVYNRENRCWRCKEVGHKRTRCRNPVRIFCSYCGRDGILSRLCHCHQHLQATHTSSSNDRYYIMVQIYNHQVLALVDTGSSHTYIGQTLRQYLLDMGMKPAGTTGMVQMADQSLVTSLEVFPVPIKFNENSIILQSAVINTLAESIILGMDFLSAFSIELRLNGELLPRPIVRKALTVTPQFNSEYQTSKHTIPQHVTHTGVEKLEPMPFQLRVEARPSIVSNIQARPAIDSKPPIPRPTIKRNPPTPLVPRFAGSYNRVDRLPSAPPVVTADKCYAMDVWQSSIAIDDRPGTSRLASKPKKKKKPRAIKKIVKCRGRQYMVDDIFCFVTFNFAPVNGGKM